MRMYFDHDESKLISTVASETLHVATAQYYVQKRKFWQSTYESGRWFGYVSCYGTRKSVSVVA